RGHARLLADLGELERGEWRLRRGLQHDRVAGGEGGRELPRREEEGEVPRHDGADHADGLAEREREGARPDGQRLAVDLRGPAREVAEHVGRERNLDVARVEHRLARAEALELRQLVEILGDEVAEPPEYAAALVRAQLRPRPGARGLARGR